MRLETRKSKMATPAISGLQVKGEAAPKNTGGMPSLTATYRANKPGSQMTSNDRSFQFVLNRPATDLTVTSLSGPSVSVRKMEHLSRVRTANYGMSTMDALDELNCGEQQSTIIIDKPHFVLCGLPVGSKEIDHHLYVNETRVGSYKTSAKALYQARRVPRPGKAFSEPAFISPDKEMINYNTNLTETLDESGKKSVPPIPPTTPVNYAHYLNMMAKSKTGYKNIPDDSDNKFHGSIPSAELEHRYVPNNLLVKHRKMTLLRRNKSNDSMEIQREHSSVSTRSGKSIETVSESVINNSLTVTSGKAAKLASRSLSNSASKINYNNPYRNTKYRGRLSLNAHKTLEFETIDGYLNYQKQSNGRHILTPRAVLRIPKPCSDTFLVQMMYDLNHPRRGASANYSDVARTKDLEEFVQTRTSSSLSRTQSNIDKFMGKRNSAKSRKSNKSAKSGVDAETIEEEEDWTDEHIMVNDDEKVDDN